MLLSAESHTFAASKQCRMLFVQNPMRHQHAIMLACQVLDAGVRFRVYHHAIILACEVLDAGLGFRV